MTANTHDELSILRSVVLDALELAGLDEDALREDYSGRGMYGHECFGVVVKNIPEIARFAAALGSLTECDDLMEDAASDEMGLGLILYFPRYTLSDDD